MLSLNNGCLSAKYETNKVQSAAHNSKNIWAVILGVCENKHPGQNLSDACNEANKMWNFFYNYDNGSIPQSQIIRLTGKGASRSNLISTLNDVCSRMGPNDVLFFYYYAHGTTYGIDCYDNTVSYNDLNSIFSRSAGRLIVCFAYSCYSGSYQIPENASFALVAVAEGIAWTHPNFSSILIEGLQGSAVRRNETAITVRGIYEYLNRVLNPMGVFPVVKYGKYNPEAPLLYVK